MAASEALKGAEAAAIAETSREQKEASEIMAERLPGLTDPNAPAQNPGASPAPGQTLQPGQNGAAPATASEPPAPKLLHPLRPDRFSPGAASAPPPGGETPAPAGPRNEPAPQPKAAPDSTSAQPVNPQAANLGRNP